MKARFLEKIVGSAGSHNPHNVNGDQRKWCAYVWVKFCLMDIFHQSVTFCTELVILNISPGQSSLQESMSVKYGSDETFHLSTFVGG